MYIEFNHLLDTHTNLRLCICSTSEQHTASPCLGHSNSLGQQTAENHPVHHHSIELFQQDSSKCSVAQRARWDRNKATSQLRLLTHNVHNYACISSLRAMYLFVAGQVLSFFFFAFYTLHHNRQANTVIRHPHGQDYLTHIASILENRGIMLTLWYALTYINIIIVPP